MHASSKRIMGAIAAATIVAGLSAGAAPQASAATTIKDSPYSSAGKGHLLVCLGGTCHGSTKVLARGQSTHGGGVYVGRGSKVGHYGFRPETLTSVGWHAWGIAYGDVAITHPA